MAAQVQAAGWRARSRGRDRDTTVWFYLYWVTVTYLSDSTLTVGELHSRVEAVGVTPHQGSTAGYVRFGPEFTLDPPEVETLGYDADTE